MSLKTVPDMFRCIALTAGRWYARPRRCPYRGEGSPRLCKIHRKAANRGPVYVAGHPGQIINPRAVRETEGT